VLPATTRRVKRGLWMTAIALRPGRSGLTGDNFLHALASGQGGAFTVGQASSVAIRALRSGIAWPAVGGFGSAVVCSCSLT